MYILQKYRHLQMANSKAIIGILFFLIGFCGEGISGIQLLQRTDLWLLPLHICSVMIWASGINILRHKQAPSDKIAFHKYILLNKWGAGALLVGFSTFPGLGVLAYSAALALAVLFYKKVENAPQEIEPTPEPKQVPEFAFMQHTMDSLRGTDLEARRLTVATLSRYGTPQAVQILRQLLSDSHAEIRSDASVALTRLEERLSRLLNSSLQRWMKNPSDRESTLHLADQYYQYACSNVLDEASQHFYLVKACDLLQHVIAQGATEFDLWLKRARIRQRLSAFEEALQDACVAIQLNPHLPDAYVLAMELALKLRDWDRLVVLAREGVEALPGAPEILEVIQWWTAQHAEQYGESIHV